MKSLLLTDLHLSNKSFKGVSLLEHQLECLENIIYSEKPNRVIIMGDIFMHRKPSPTALIGLKRLVDFMSKYVGQIVMLRGNHDSETKADDGVTALSLFAGDDLWGLVKVITQFYIDDRGKQVFIPHYEDENYILDLLQNHVPPGYEVFGHFGYSGCLNSVGDQDFHISRESFNNPTFLGHIHKHKVDHNGKHPLVILGTPYTINFGDNGKTCYYGLQTNEEDWEFKEVEHGPRHICLPYADLDEDMVGFINDPKYKTLLRLILRKDDVIVEDRISRLQSIYLDYKYAPLEEHIKVKQSVYEPDQTLLKLNDQIIEDYIEHTNTSFDKEDLSWGLGLLRDETN